MVNMPVFQTGASGSSPGLRTNGEVGVLVTYGFVEPVQRVRFPSSAPLRCIWQVLLIEAVAA